MQTKYKVLIVVACIIGAAAFGRWSAPEKVRVETKVVEVEKKTTDSQSEAERQKHKETTTTEVTHPDGTKETTTKTVEDTNSNRSSNTSTTDDKSKSSDTTKVVEKSHSRLNLSALVGAPVSIHGAGPLVYGGHISRDLIGPISVGVFGLSSGIGGFSIGLTF